MSKAVSNAPFQFSKCIQDTFCSCLQNDTGKAKNCAKEKKLQYTLSHFNFKFKFSFEPIASEAVLHALTWCKDAKKGHQLQISFQQFYINKLCKPKEKKKSRSVSHKLIIPSEQTKHYIWWHTCHTAFHENFKLYYVSSLRSKTKLPFHSIWLPLSSLLLPSQFHLKDNRYGWYHFKMRCIFYIRTRVLVCVCTNELNWHTILFIPYTKQFAILNHSFTTKRNEEKTDMNGEKICWNYFLRFKSNVCRVWITHAQSKQEKTSICRVLPATVMCGICWLLSARWCITSNESKR